MGVAIFSDSPMVCVTDEPNSVIAYVGARVLDARGDRFEPNTILGCAARISVAVPAGSFALPTAARKENLKGRYIIAGLINSHVHLATLATPRDARAYLRPELYSGVTMVRDMAGNVRLIAELKRDADHDEIIAPDIYYAALMAGKSETLSPAATAPNRKANPEVGASYFLSAHYRAMATTPGEVMTSSADRPGVAGQP